MKIIDSFIDDKKGKLKDIIKLDKGYDYYLGIVVMELENNSQIIQKCENIFLKSNKNLKLIDICKIDSNNLLIFEMNSDFIKGTINGVLMSISKYLEIDQYTVPYMKTLYNMVFDSWEEQNYFKLYYKDIEYDLRMLRSGL